MRQNIGFFHRTEKFLQRVVEYNVKQMQRVQIMAKVSHRFHHAHRAVDMRSAWC